MFHSYQLLLLSSLFLLWLDRNQHTSNTINCTHKYTNWPINKPQLHSGRYNFDTLSSYTSTITCFSLTLTRNKDFVIRYVILQGIFAYIVFKKSLKTQ